MKRVSLFIFLVGIANITFVSYAGKVVFLRGTACAGKTSLCGELIKQDNSWRYVEEDGIFYIEAAERYKSEFPDEFAAIQEVIDSQNLLHAVMRNQILFKSDATDEQRLKAKNAIAAIQHTLNSRKKEQETENKDSWSGILRDRITQTIIDLAQQNNVIVDTWFLKPEHIQQIADRHKVVHVIAYSAFPEIIKRTIKRNHAALMNGKDISNFRFFHQTLKSFTGTYDLSDSPDGSIASVDRDAVIHGLDIVTFLLVDSPSATGASKTFSRGEFSLQEFEEYRKNLINGFTSQTAYVVPKLPFDMMVMTDENDPAASAKQIINFVESYGNNS